MHPDYKSQVIKGFLKNCSSIIFKKNGTYWLQTNKANVINPFRKKLLRFDSGVIPAIIRCRRLAENLQCNFVDR